MEMILKSQMSSCKPEHIFGPFPFFLIQILVPLPLSSVLLSDYPHLLGVVIHFPRILFPL